MLTRRRIREGNGIPIPVFLPGGSHGQKSLSSYISPWVMKSQTQFKWLSTYKAEKAMAPHSSTLAWRIPWMEEPGRLLSMGSQRVGHDWATSLSLFPFMRWRKKGQPIPVFLPGESQGRGNLVGCRLWGHTESDTTEVMQQQYNLDNKRWQENYK